MPGCPVQMLKPLQRAAVAPTWPCATPPHRPWDREARMVGLGGPREEVAGISGLSRALSQSGEETAALREPPPSTRGTEVPGRVGKTSLPLSPAGGLRIATTSHSTAGWAAGPMTPATTLGWGFSLYHPPLSLVHPSPTPAAAQVWGSQDGLCLSTGGAMMAQPEVKAPPVLVSLRVLPLQLQVLGALAVLWLGSMALTYLLWQVALPPTWDQVHPKDMPGSWGHGSSPAWKPLEADAGQQRDSCRLVLVESIPQDLPSAARSPSAQPLGQAWLQLLDTAQESVHVASYYWSLTGPDIGVNDSSSQLGEALLQKLQQLLGRNISLAVATSSPTLARNSTDLQVLASRGAQVRQVPMGRLTRGVLHSKFWVVDGRHVYMGSANMDWRSLTQVKELGAVIYNCSHLAQDLEKTFQTYWVLGAPEAVLPKTWPQNFSSHINRSQPFRGLFDGVPTTAYFSVRQIEKKLIRTPCSPLTGQSHREPSGLALQTPAASAGSSGSQHSRGGGSCGPGASPPVLCPGGRTPDLEALLAVMGSAQEFIYASVMEYFPTTRFSHPRRYWPVLDNALRAAAFAKGVRVRLLVGCGLNTDPTMFPYLRSLQALSDPATNVSVDVKVFIVPVGNHSNIPFSRVNHSKFMVTEKAAYIGEHARVPAGGPQGGRNGRGRHWLCDLVDTSGQGTSNWSEDYFSSTAGVGLVVTQSPGAQPARATVQEQLRLLFERDWSSRYAVGLDGLAPGQDCVWRG
ncbi:5'-3' exonuclease PLD4 [Plecturocebus cupreus]